MRVVAQADYPYEILIPNNAARRWVTSVLKRLQVSRQYVSRRQGFDLTGDPAYVARYVGMINPDKHRMLMTSYLPYAPPGVQYSCPTCPQY